MILRMHEMPRGASIAWQARARCRGVVTSGLVRDDTAIFPVSRADKTIDEDTAAFIETMCGACPVRRECLDFAVQLGYTGVWGGRHLSETDVRDRRRRATGHDDVEAVSA